jgi:sarcosine oxidase
VPGTENVDVVVVGGGAMGSAAAWQLAARGRSVLLLERFLPGHTNGASHGASRNFNLSYAEPTYLSMLVEALPLWRELEAQTGSALLDQVGIVNHGANPDFPAVVERMTEVGLEAQMLPAHEAGRRWPGIRFETDVLYTPAAGRLNADAAVAALQRAATALGAEVRHGARVTRLTVKGDSEVRVDFEDANGESSVRARTAVVTVGAWTQKLLGGIVALPRLVVTQEQPGHFAALAADTPWPGFNHYLDPADAATDYWYSNIYGMFTPGHGVKAGWHGVGPVTDPDARSFEPEPVQFAALRRYVRDWLPGADPESATAISCTYTTSPDGNFVIDRVGPVVVAAGFSGHGFKFTPVVGRILADLVDVGSGSPPLFSLSDR